MFRSGSTPLVFCILKHHVRSSASYPWRATSSEGDRGAAAFGTAPGEYRMVHVPALYKTFVPMIGPSGSVHSPTRATPRHGAGCRTVQSSKAQHPAARLPRGRLLASGNRLRLGTR